MSNENLFLVDHHPLTQRSAILEDDGTSAWLYLTEPESRKPSGDAWVYNRIAAPTMDAIRSYRGGPPPAAQGYASEGSLCPEPMKQAWSLLWSDDGEAVALFMNNAPVACILAWVKGGYSRGLIQDGPWGHPWSEELYRATFGIR